MSKVSQQHEIDRVLELIEFLEQMDENKPNTKANKNTISDNNGGRIYL